MLSIKTAFVSLKLVVQYYGIPGDMSGGAIMTDALEEGEEKANSVVWVLLRALVTQPLPSNRNRRGMIKGLVAISQPYSHPQPTTPPPTHTLEQIPSLMPTLFHSFVRFLYGNTCLPLLVYCFRRVRNSRLGAIRVAELQLAAVRLINSE